MSARGPRWGSVRAPADDCMTAASIKDLLDKVVFVSSRWSPPLGSKDSSEGKEARTEGGIGLVLIELQTASDVIESQRRAQYARSRGTRLRTPGWRESSRPELSPTCSRPRSSPP